MTGGRDNLFRLRERYPQKFRPVEEIFAGIRRGSSIFIGSSCGEPQHLMHALVRFVETGSHGIFGAQVIHVWTLGVAPYADSRFEQNFRHNSFFISDSSRDTINSGRGDYTPTFLSQIPSLLRRGIIAVDVALVQVSLPDAEGVMSLGISVDIVKAMVEHAGTVIAQVNSLMPRTQGDTGIPAESIHYLVPHDEPLLEYRAEVSDEIASQIGRHIARIVRDGDTIQVGYGSIPDAVLRGLHEKRDLGIHSELLTDGLVNLMKLGVVNNSRKSVDPGTAVASFCMGTAETYAYLHENPSVRFMPIDYTNDPFVIASQHRMVAINSVMQIDLTGQATAESLGTVMYSGIGGQADFMRGAALSPGGKSIIAMRSTSNDGSVSRIVACLEPGASATLVRGDVHYVVTEYGIAYLHGKNIRERAMALIAVAHPHFRGFLIERAKEIGYIYRDQLFIPGKAGEYPGHLEAYRTTEGGMELFIRPVMISDEEMIRGFFYSLSDRSIYTRFFTNTQYMPHSLLQKYVVIDYTKEMTLLAMHEDRGIERLVGMAQYVVERNAHRAAASFIVRDDCQNRGIGTTLLRYLTSVAKREGLLGFSAMVFRENAVMRHLFEKMGFDTALHDEGGIVHLSMDFTD
ncbi:MAG: GNAT family N-acetyltransferase [Spirochaetes bacterium]|nr:GNAT family N-acetyltransferase [Spirochaetota bacterium]